MMISILSLLISLPHICFAGDAKLNFYGFAIGESREVSLRNIKDRELYFIDSIVNAKNVAKNRSAFEVMKHPDHCAEESANGLGTITCSMTKGDVESMALYHLSGKLVRIVARFRDSSGNIKPKIVEKFGPKQVAMSNDDTKAYETIVRGNANLDVLLSAPFALKNQCNDCSVTMFPQNLATDAAFFMKDSSGTYLTLFSLDAIKAATKLLSESKTIKEAKNTSF